MVEEWSLRCQCAKICRANAGTRCHAVTGMQECVLRDRMKHVAKTQESVCKQGSFYVHRLRQNINVSLDLVIPLFWRISNFLLF